MAGWLAFADYGTATGPIYAAQEAGLKVHVWVDETRPRNQGAFLTAWELQQQGVEHTVIADNTGAATFPARRAAPQPPSCPTICYVLRPPAVAAGRCAQVGT